MIPRRSGLLELSGDSTRGFRAFTTRPRRTQTSIGPTLIHTTRSSVQSRPSQSLDALPNPEVLESSSLTINHQPPTTNHQPPNINHQIPIINHYKGAVASIHHEAQASLPYQPSTISLQGCNRQPHHRGAVTSIHHHAQTSLPHRLSTVSL